MHLRQDGRLHVASVRAVIAHLHLVLGSRQRLGVLAGLALFCHAVGVIAHLAVLVFHFHQAVDVGLETGAQLGEIEEFGEKC